MWALLGRTWASAVLRLLCDVVGFGSGEGLDDVPWDGEGVFECELGEGGGAFGGAEEHVGDGLDGFESDAAEVVLEFGDGCVAVFREFVEGESVPVVVFPDGGHELHGARLDGDEGATAFPVGDEAMEGGDAGALSPCEGFQGELADEENVLIGKGVGEGVPDGFHEVIEPHFKQSA